MRGRAGGDVAEEEFTGVYVAPGQGACRLPSAININRRN